MTMHRRDFISASAATTLLAGLDISSAYGKEH